MTVKNIFFSITCPQCHKERNLSFSFLVKNYQRYLTIPCKKCGYECKIKVDKVFMARVVKNSGFKLENKSMKLKFSYRCNDKLPEIDIHLKSGRNLIGRSPKGNNNENVISLFPIDPYISRDHLLVKVTTDENGVRYTIRDKNSTNGVYLNQRRVELEDEIFLKVNDLIGIGKSLIKVKADD